MGILHVITQSVSAFVQVDNMTYTLEKIEDVYDVDMESLSYLKDHEDPEGDRWVLNFGPAHPATHGTLRTVVILDGERIVRAVPHIGYLHSGFEKLGEHLNYNQFVTITSRMNYLSPVSNNIAWHHAVEKLFDIEITPRCKVLRTIMAEVGRILDHLLCVGASSLDLGAFTGFLYVFNQRERILDLCDLICGQRFHTDWTRVGGLMQDIPDQEAFIRLLKKFIHEEFPPALNDLESLLNKNRIFHDRTRNIGVITKDEAVAWSLTGPVARASGVVRDIRKDEPYLCYADNWDNNGASAVDFKVPVMEEGDVFARYYVRLYEMRESVKIIEQLIDNIPDGPVDVLPDTKIAKPSKPDVYGSIEGLIQQFELIMPNRGWQAPVAECYASQETANGEYGFYIVGDGSAQPWRVRTRPPSFMHFQIFAKLLEGHLLSDIVAILGSLNIIAGELDR